MPDLRDRLQGEADRIDLTPEMLERVHAGHRRREVRRRVAAVVTAAAVTVGIVVWLSGAFLGADGRDRPAAVPGGDPLAGTWTVEITPEAATRAGLDAGFDARDVDRQVERMFAGGSPVRVTLAFDAGELTITERVGTVAPQVAWGGRYQVVAADRVVAADNWGFPLAGFYLEYAFVVDGDALTVDLLRDDYPTPSATELEGERLTQTIIFESASFTRGS